MRWFFVHYGEKDICASRKGAALSSMQSTYCLARDRNQRTNELSNLIFSDFPLDSTKHCTVTLSNVARHKRPRTARRVKRAQTSRSFWLASVPRHRRGVR